MTELSIRPDDIRDALQKYVAEYQPDAASKEEVGYVAEAGDGELVGAHRRRRELDGPFARSAGGLGHRVTESQEVFRR